MPADRTAEREPDSGDAGRRDERGSRAASVLFGSQAEWWEMARPFRHITACNVLDDADYRRISKVFGDLLAERSPDGECRFRRSTPKYDALIMGVDSTLAGILTPFFAPQWLNGIADLVGLPFLPVIDGALHSSPPGSRSGWVHSDYCSAWFHQPEAFAGLLFPDRTKCEYFSGAARSRDAVPKKYVRAVTVIFYLNNDGWEPGDGGETELLAAGAVLKDAPVKKVPPLNNSLLIFECRRHSYHRFITNKRQRNSIILWLHSTLPVATERWGPPTH